MSTVRTLKDAHDIVRKIDKHFDELPAISQDAILWCFKTAEITFGREMMRLRIKRKEDKGKKA